MELRFAVPALFALVLVACGSPEHIERDLATHLPRHRPAPSEDESVHRGVHVAEPSTREIARLQYSECEPGEIRECFAPGTGPSTEPGHTVMRCVESETGAMVFSRAACATPLVLSFGDDKVAFTTSAAPFAVGPYAATAWVSAATPWLALDLDGSGCIETQAELFGADAHGRDGFEKLARYDDHHDGAIDARDAVFARLLVWRDKNQDKVCTEDEISRLADGPVRSISLGATALAPRASSYEGAHAPMVWTDDDGRPRTGRVVDVYLAPIGSEAPVARRAAHGE